MLLPYLHNLSPYGKDERPNMKFTLEQLAASGKEFEWEVARKFGHVTELSMQQCLQLQKIDWRLVLQRVDEEEAGFMASQKHWCQVLRGICQNDAAALQAIDAVLASHQNGRPDVDESLGKLVPWDTREIEAARQQLQQRIDSLKPMVTDDLSADIKRRAEIAVLYSEALLALCHQQSNVKVAEHVARIQALQTQIDEDQAWVQTMTAWASSLCA